METPETKPPEVKAKKKSSWMKGFVINPPRTTIVPDYRQFKQSGYRMRCKQDPQ